MIYVGLLCFGLFVGVLLCVGIMFMEDLASWQKAVVFILGVVASGVIFKFLNILEPQEHPDARAGYPIGLLIALLWSLNGYAAVNLRSSDKVDRFFGWLQMVGLVVVTTVLVTYVVLQAPMPSLGTRIVFSLALAVVFSVTGLLIYNAAIAMKRNGNGKSH